MQLQLTLRTTSTFFTSQVKFCRVLIEELQKNQIVDSSKVVLLHLHNFYKELSDEDRVRVASGLYNFDHPGRPRKVCVWVFARRPIEPAY